MLILAGIPLTMKVNEVMRRINEEKMMPQDTEKIIREIYEKALDRDIDQLLKTGDDDFSFAIPGLSRFRVSAYKQRGSLAAVIRVIAFRLPDYKQLRIPEQVMKLSELNKGLVLVTGPTGSGKSTTLAAMIDYVNVNRSAHVITIEDPIEYVHEHKRCMVNQREVGQDVPDFASALRAALREDPDVILVGEMRDFETISAAVTAAETGHLVFSTLHTTSAADTINRIIDVYPEHQQGQIRTQLANTLVGVISQTLLPKKDSSGRVAALEILNVIDSCAAMIRDNKVHMIPSAIQTGKQSGMMCLDQELARYARSGMVAEADALEKCHDKAEFYRYFNMK